MAEVRVSPGLRGSDFVASGSGHLSFGVGKPRAITVRLGTHLVWLLLAGAAICNAAQPADPKKPVADDFFGIWLEEKRETGEKVYDKPADLLGFELAAKEGGCWGRRGESVYSSLGRVRLRTDKDPVWLDFIGSTIKVKLDEKWHEKVYIRPGIAKRDGKKLIWVWAKDWHLADPKDIEDWAKRPKSFDVKKDDPWEKMTLYPGPFIYVQD
jgi:hypothetical protein